MTHTVRLFVLAVVVSTACGDNSAPPPELFTIALSTSRCEEPCPVYDLMVDQSGAVMINGRGHTRLQGWAGKEVSPSIAGELFESIVAADYWALRDVYREEADGCSEVEAERPTYVWNVTRDGVAKIVVDYQGCQGVAELDALRQIPALLTEKLALEDLLHN